MNPVLFLDVDGVLIAYPEGEHVSPNFTPRCVDAFRLILQSFPRLKVVFCTTWRLPQHVNRLHEQWLQANLPLSIAWDGTPDTRDHPEVSRMARRGEEIRLWLADHPACQNWVVVDDDRMGIESVIDPARCVFTNPARGLEIKDAERVIHILR